MSDFKTYHCWIVASKDDFVDALIVKLIRMGFTVGPASGKRVFVKHENSACIVVALTIKRTCFENDDQRNEYDADGINAEIADILTNVIKTKYMSMVVSEATECVWNVGNLSPADERHETQVAAWKLN